jgi:hypothetical protein
MGMVFTGMAQAPINMANLKVRVERPDRIRDPQSQTRSNCEDGKDSFFNEVQINSTTFFGYTANGVGNGGSTVANDPSTCLIQGSQVTGMTGGVTATVYPSDHYNSAATYGSCGLWLDGTYVTRNLDGSIATIYGFAHAETSCNYPSTTKSMALITSTDGQNWSLVSQIISDAANTHTNSDSGEGDCTPVPFNSHIQLYCRKATVGTTTVGRSPLSGCSPIFSQGCWRKWEGASSGWTGAWNADDVALTATNSSGGSNPSNLYGSSASLWADTNNEVLLNASVNTNNTAPLMCTDPGVSNVGGIKMSFSYNTDGSGFDMLTEPILCEDDHTFDQASANGDLIVYPSVLSATDGSRTWSGSFLLSYQYVPNTKESKGSTPPPNERTLVMRQVSASIETSAQTPHVGVAISRWYNATIDQRISSTEAVPYNFSNSGLTYETRTGYIMTVAPPSNIDPNPHQIIECVSTSTGANPEHLMTFTGATDCNGTGHVFLRTAGWLYSTSQPNTVPVYRCFTTGSNGTYHYTSTSSTCEGLGTKDILLGYALAN